MMRHILPLLALTSLGSMGCSDQELHSLVNMPRYGDLVLTGRLCHPETKVWLRGATVYTHLIDANDDLWGTLDTVADDSGYFRLERMEAGQEYKVYVQWGSEVVQILDITMPDTDFEMPNPGCGSVAGLSAAVVTGDYDDYTEVLPQLGIDAFETVDGSNADQLRQFLLNADALSDYDVIFFPGGHVEEGVFYADGGYNTNADIDAIRAAIKDYVKGGGVVFASDWSYDVVERSWPNKITFLGDDMLADDAQQGTEASVAADIVDYDLSDALGTSTAIVKFDLDQWPVIDSVSDDVTVHMRGTAPYQIGFNDYELRDAPLLVSFNAGKGMVILSSFRQVSNMKSDMGSVLSYMIDQVSDLTE